MKRGGSPYLEYSDAVKKAEAELERKALEGITAAGAKNWTAWAWILERKWPERYGTFLVVAALCVQLNGRGRAVQSK